MKKILYGAALAALVAGAIALKADFNTNSPVGPFNGISGGVVSGNSGVQFGAFPKDQACSSILPAIAAVDLVPGDAVVLAGTTFFVSVSKTTTAADPLAVGIVLSTSPYGTPVQVCTAGYVRAKVNQTTTHGMKLITSGTAGALTPASSVTETLYTGLSSTAVVFRALEAKTYSGTTIQVFGQVMAK